MKITFWPKSGAGKVSLCFMLLFAIVYFVLWRLLSIDIISKTDPLTASVALLLIAFLVLSILLARFDIVSRHEQSVLVYLCIITSIVILYIILFAGATSLFPTLREVLWPLLFNEIPLKYL
jgi:hypothetical protein